MGVPNTRGQFRTRVEDMEVGDYIACGWSGHGGSTNDMYGLGDSLETALANELPLIGTRSPRGYFFFIKARNGLLVADRVVQSGILINEKVITSKNYNLYGLKLDKPDCLTIGPSIKFVETWPEAKAYDYRYIQKVAVSKGGAYIACFAYRNDSNGNILGPWRIVILKVGTTSISKVQDTGWITATPFIVNGAWHPDGKRLYVLMSDSTIKLFRFENEVLSSVTLNSNIAPTVASSGYAPYSIEVLPNGNYILFTKRPGSRHKLGYAKIVNDNTITELPVDLNPDNSGHMPLKISPDSKYLLTQTSTDADANARVFAWYKFTDTGLNRLPAPAEQPVIGNGYWTLGLWTPDSKYALFCGYDTTLNMFKVVNDELIKTPLPAVYSTPLKKDGFDPSGSYNGLDGAAVSVSDNTLIISSYYSDSGEGNSGTRFVCLPYDPLTQTIAPQYIYATTYPLSYYKVDPYNPHETPYVIDHGSHSGTGDQTVQLFKYVNNHVIGDYYLRALSGGSAHIDLDGESRSVLSYQLGAWPPDNEYDAIINKSDLEGKITPGDAAVWHDNVMATITNSAADTTICSTQMVVTTRRRGNVGYVGKYAGASELVGIRPVLEYFDPVTAEQTNIWF